MRDITKFNKNKTESEEDFYSDVDSTSSQSYGWSCVTLFISCMILYVAASLLIWKFIPNIRNFQSKVTHVRSNIKVRTDPNTIDKLKSETNEKLQSTNDAVGNTLKQKTQSTTNSIIESGEGQINNSIEQTTNNIENDLKK